MKYSGGSNGRLVLVLGTSVCLAAAGLFAADTPSASKTQKQVRHVTARKSHRTATHTVARKHQSHPAVSHSAARRQVTHHPVAAHPGVKRAAHSTTSGGKRTVSHRAAAASRRKGSRGRYRRGRTLTGKQRLARLHLQPERVQEIQQALIHAGYLQGDANGQWDARTHNAMLRYQTDNGFLATGLPEAKSLMKLGLGSHPLPADLDPGQAGTASPGAARGDPPAPHPSTRQTPPS